MSGPVDESKPSRLAPFFRWVVAHRWWVIAFYAVVLPASVFYALRVGQDNSLDRLIVQTDPDYINTKAFEALRVNADANFDFLKAVFAVKSLPDLITLQTEFARKQVETITGQSKDFGALAQKAMADAVEPIKEQVARSFKLAV